MFVSFFSFSFVSWGRQRCRTNKSSIQVLFTRTHKRGAICLMDYGNSVQSISRTSVMLSQSKHQGGDLSPVPIGGSQPTTTTTIDIGASPPQYVDNRTTDISQLSDLSIEIANAESRLGALEAYGSHGGCNPSASLIIPIKKLNLVKQLKPLVSLQIEVKENCIETVALYDGDDEKKCHDVAMRIADKHNLDSEAVDMLLEHIVATLREYQPQRPARRPISQETSAGSAGRSVAPIADAEMPSLPTTVRSVESAARSISPTAPKEVTAPTTATAKTNSSSGPTRSKPVKQQPQATARTSRAAAEVKAPERSVSNSSRNGPYANVRPRYLSPAPIRGPPPQPEELPHAPQVCKKTLEIARTSPYHSQPAFERLHAKVAELQERKKERIRMASPQQRVFAAPKIKGLDWGDARGLSPEDYNVYKRLHEQAQKRQDHISQLAAAAQAEKLRKEMEEAVFHPRINNPERSSSKVRYSDPFSLSPPSKREIESLATKRLTTIEMEVMENCTFKPKINQTTSSVFREKQQFVEKPSSDRLGLSSESRIRNSSLVSASNQRPVSPLRSPVSTANSAKPQSSSKSPLHRSPASVSPVRPTLQRSPSPLANSATAVTAKGARVSPVKRSDEPIADRLYRAAKEKRERIEREKKKLETLDPKTGRPLFQPFTGR